MLKERLMKITNNGQWISFMFGVIFLLLICGVPPGTGIAVGEEGPEETKPPFNEIRIVTDQAIMDSKARQTEFKGNVKVDIDDTTIAADWLKVIYRSGLDTDPEMPMDQNGIKEIIARGNVRILVDGKTAVTEEAVYMPETDRLVLTGENSKISSGADYISGDKIILNRRDGTFKVESTGKRQVEAVFFQAQPDRE
jgi:lipopolysaccharide export system protein LptA